MSKIFIDVGTHIGESIENFYKDVPDAASYKIYGFEPNPALEPYLLKITEKYKNVTILTHAAWIRDEKIDLYLGNVNRQDGSTIIKNKITGSVNYLQPVSVDALDFGKWFTENFTQEDFVLLKVNIEGGEYPLMFDLMQRGLVGRFAQIYLSSHHHKIGDPVQIILYRTLESCFVAECNRSGVVLRTNDKGYHRFEV